MSFRDKVLAGVSRRDDFTLVAGKTGLLIVDVQACFALDKEDDGGDDYWSTAHTRAVTNISKLAQSFRVVRDESSCGAEVIFCFIKAATKDCRDVSWDYKLSGPLLKHIPTVETDPSTIFLPDLQPNLESGKGDILVPKTSCNVFVSTNLDYLLRNLRVEQLVICGQLTNQCVESAVRNAADLGYLVTVVEDACAAKSEKEHLCGLNGMKGFARIVETSQVEEEMDKRTDKERQKTANKEKENAVDQKQMKTLPADKSKATMLQYLVERGVCSESTADQLSNRCKD
jgi:ureidoacrylate peracid hydrolase